MKLPAKMRSARGMTRREFVGRTLVTAAGVIAGAPAFLRGQNLNSKLNIAFIACGGRANASFAELTLSAGVAKKGGKRSPEAPAGSTAPHPDENVAVICDINQDAIDAAAKRFPKAKKF